MRLPTFLVLIACSSLAAPVAAQTLPDAAALSGSWTIEFDRELNGIVTPTTESTFALDLRTASPTGFVATYVSAAPEGTYIGAITTGRSTTVITLSYHDGTYYNVLAGALTNSGSFEGTWYDGVGNRGDFRLTRRSR